MLSIHGAKQVPELIATALALLLAACWPASGSTIFSVSISPDLEIVTSDGKRVKVWGQARYSAVRYTPEGLALDKVLGEDLSSLLSRKSLKHLATSKALILEELFALHAKHVPAAAELEQVVSAEFDFVEAGPSQGKPTWHGTPLMPIKISTGGDWGQSLARIAPGKAAFETGALRTGIRSGEIKAGIVLELRAAKIIVGLTPEKQPGLVLSRARLAVEVPHPAGGELGRLEPGMLVYAAPDDPAKLSGGWSIRGLVRKPAK